MLLHIGALPLAANAMICAPTQSPEGTTGSKGSSEMKPSEFDEKYDLTKVEILE